MAGVLALTRDLLFGSRVQGALAAVGHDVRLVGESRQARELLVGESTKAQAANEPIAVLVVDLTDAALDGAGALEALRDDGALEGVRTLAFYSHVEASARERAERAGFDLVVARSRMAREAAALVAGLLERA